MGFEYLAHPGSWQLQQVYPGRQGGLDKLPFVTDSFEGVTDILGIVEGQAALCVTPSGMAVLGKGGCFISRRHARQYGGFYFLCQ
jgi:hypothetical protein